MTPDLPPVVEHGEPEGALRGAQWPVMRAVRDRGGQIISCATRYDHERGGRVLTLEAFYPEETGYSGGGA